MCRYVCSGFTVYDFCYVKLCPTGNLFYSLVMHRYQNMIHYWSNTDTTGINIFLIMLITPNVTRAHAHSHMSMYVYVCVRVCTCVCVFACVCVYACVYARLHVCWSMCVVHLHTCELSCVHRVMYVAMYVLMAIPHNTITLQVSCFPHSTYQCKPFSDLMFRIIITNNRLADKKLGTVNVGMVDV